MGRKNLTNHKGEKRIAIFHFSNTTKRLIDGLEELGINSRIVSVPSFASECKQKLMGSLNPRTELCDIHTVIQTRALALFQLGGNMGSRSQWSWQEVGEDTRVNCLLQLQKYSFQLGLSFTESFLYIDCILCACHELVTAYDLDLVAWGIMPHSLYDYALMRFLRSTGIRQLIFQEHSYLRSGSFLYTPDIDIVHLPSTRDGDMEKALNEESKEIAAQVVMGGKAAKCDPAVAVGAVRAYVPNGFEIDINRSYINTTDPRGLDMLGKIESYCKEIDEPISVASTRGILQARLKRLNSKGYSKFAVLYLTTEPELTISPMGKNICSNFEFILQVLAFLPDEYGLLIKEHPGTILERLPNSLQLWTKTLDDVRPRKLIESLRNCDRIEWCPMTLRLSELRELGVSLVATTAGTVGFEAAVLGLPVICYASTPYAHLDCVYQMTNGKEHREYNEFMHKANAYIDRTSPSLRSYHVLEVGCRVSPMIANGELYCQNESAQRESERSLQLFISAALMEKQK